jgi:hypothetical protein
MQTMDNSEPLPIQLLVTANVPAEQEQAIVDAFGALGVVTHTRVIPARRGAGELQWMVLATLPLHAFLGSLGSKLAENAHQHLKRLIDRTFEKRPQVSSAEVLVLQDVATRLQVVLELDLPTEAYRQLLSLDLSTFQQGPLHYDPKHRKWRSELDEWQQRQAPPPGG